MDKIGINVLLYQRCKINMIESEGGKKYVLHTQTLRNGLYYHAQSSEHPFKKKKSSDILAEQGMEPWPPLLL